jgi:glycosyltransferase involved in cell wall biosynthesis
VTRIGIDYTSAVRQGAGIGRYTRNLIRALADIDHTTEYVLFSAGRDTGQSPWPDNFRGRSLPLSDAALAFAWQKLRLPIAIEWITGRLDIFHSPDFVLPPVRRARTVLTVHDLSFMRFPECSSAPLLEYLMRAVPRSVARADMILADSESTRQDLIELLRVPEERLRVVYAGVEPRFQPQRDSANVQAVLSRYGIRVPFVLGVGTLQPRKNFVRLIRAYGLLKRGKGLPHSLVIAGGRGWLYEEILRTIDELGLQQDVQLVGFVADEDLPALYSAASVFAYPSLYEGFGIPVLEAMGCGTPVVTSNVSSLPEVAGDAAMMVSPDDIEALADVLWRVIDDDSQRRELVQRGFEQAKRFQWRTSAQRLRDAYAELLHS